MCLEMGVKKLSFVDQRLQTATQMLAEPMQGFTSRHPISIFKYDLER